MTKRTEENERLFPSLKWDHGWSLSIQADKYGYQCSPKRRLDDLEKYDTVEVRISGPLDNTEVDPNYLRIPEYLKKKFTPLVSPGDTVIGANLTWNDVEILKEAILQASLHPNDGIPKGNITWSNKQVFHGTSQDGATNIIENGIDINNHGNGYFGKAFYVTPDAALAQSNYADFNDSDDEGVVLATRIKEGALILDLRNEDDFKKWSSLNTNKEMSNNKFHIFMMNNNIDGVYDRSMDGMAIYNKNILTPCYIYKKDNDKTVENKKNDEIQNKM